MAAKILVVDDEAKIVKLVRAYLEQAGYTVVVAEDGQTALIQARREKPDLVILDLGLPGIDGLDVARTLRREGDTPIIMLTARVDDTDRIIGLELGADDYVSKPFNPRELVARVRAVLRRTAGAAPPVEILRGGDLVLDVQRAHGDVGRRAARSHPDRVRPAASVHAESGPGVHASRVARPRPG